MAFFAAFALVLVLIIRPQEVWTVLNVFRLLDVFTGLAVLGVIADFATGKLKKPYSPQLPFLGAFVLIVYSSTLLIVGRPGLDIAFKSAIIPSLSMLVVMYGGRAFTRLRAYVALLVASCAFVSVVAVQQGLTEPVCIELPKDETGVPVAVEDGEPDGRPCENRFLCEKSGGKDNMDYGCERLGWFKTVSTGLRVRWRGQLGDPNELSVFIGAVIPLLFALTASINKKVFSLIALGIIGVGLWAVILSQSRGGQLVVGTVFALYFISRFGAKGVIGAILLSLPVLLLGGREGEDADASAHGRTEILYDGVTIFAQHPIIGVGASQFAEHNWWGMTAHNSYLLAAGELGFPGLFAWSGLYWSCLKIPLTIVRRPPPLMDPRLKPFASALFVSFIGMAIGIFFLSFTFKQLLFVWFGIAGALYGIVKEQDPSFEVKIGWRDFVFLAGFDIAIIAVIWAYTRMKAAP